MTDDDKVSFSDGLTALGVAFDKPIDTAMRQVYWQFLKDMSLEEFQTAVSLAGRRLKFFPKPAELRELAEGPKRITAAMQWANVRKVMDKLDIYGSPDFGPLVNAVIHALGGWKVLCEKTNPELGWYQKDFERLYADFSAKDLGTLRTAAHIGEHCKVPEWAGLGPVPSPVKQLPSVERNGVQDLVRELADSKVLEQ